MPAASFGTLLDGTNKSFLARKNDFLYFILLGTIAFGIVVAWTDHQDSLLHRDIAQELSTDEENIEKMLFLHQSRWLRPAENDPLTETLKQKGIENPDAYISKKKHELAFEQTVGGILNLLAGIIVGPMLYAIYVFLALNKKKSRKELLYDGWNKIITIIAISLLNALIFGVPFIVGIALSVAIYLSIHAPFISLFIFLLWLVYFGYLGPRLCFAPVFALLENKKAIASLKRTYKATKGYWWKIVSNCVLFGLILFIAGIAAIIVIGMISTIFASLAPIVGLLVLALSMTFIHQCMMAYGITFVTRLAETILAHPRKS